MKDVIGTKTAIMIFSILLENPYKEFKEIELIIKSCVGKSAGGFSGYNWSGSAWQANSGIRSGATCDAITLQQNSI